eukprot:1806373-Prymnesium_polylepis.2
MLTACPGSESASVLSCRCCQDSVSRALHAGSSHDTEVVRSANPDLSTWRTPGEQQGLNMTALGEVMTGLIGRQFTFGAKHYGPISKYLIDNKLVTFHPWYPTKMLNYFDTAVSTLQSEPELVEKVASPGEPRTPR